MASSQTPQDATPPAIRACLFDMDGLLINSEDLYTVCTNAVLREYGKPDLPWDIKAQMQGRPAPEAGKILFDWAQLPIGREEYIAKVQDVQTRLFPTTEPLAGVVSLLQTLSKKSDPSVYMALATSSHSKNFHLKSSHLDIFNCFRPENTVLGDDPRIGKGRGKPAPDIYLLALETVNEVIRKEGGREIKPAECLVFEDSVPGVESGRRAGMQVVWCPHPGLLNEYKGREERVLAGLMGEHKEVEERNEKIGVVTDGGQKRSAGAPGEIGDGWGRLLHTLEDFPYESYGINV